jgi:hypothetical protein
MIRARHKFGGQGVTSVLQTSKGSKFTFSQPCSLEAAKKIPLTTQSNFDASPLQILHLIGVRRLAPHVGSIASQRASGTRAVVTNRNRALQHIALHDAWKSKCENYCFPSSLPSPTQPVLNTDSQGPQDEVMAEQINRQNPDAIEIQITGRAAGDS